MSASEESLALLASTPEEREVSNFTLLYFQSKLMVMDLIIIYGDYHIPPQF